jgi:hypothetical protein
MVEFDALAEVPPWGPPSAWTEVRRAECSRIPTLVIRRALAGRRRSLGSGPGDGVASNHRDRGRSPMWPSSMI